MPVSYTKTGGQGHVYQVPDYPEAADGPKAFKDFADFLDLVLPPVGTIMPFVGSSAPTGWLMCDGSEYSSATYPKLSALCGTKFSTSPQDPAASAGNFRVPNLKGRVIAGFDSSQTEFDTLGEKGGAKNVTLTVSNLPAHDHSVPNHTHTGSGTVTISSATGSHDHGLSGTFTSASNGDHAHLYTDTTHDAGTNFTRTGTSSGATQNTTGTIKTTTTAGAHTHTVTLSGNTGAATDNHSHTGTVNLTFNSSGATTTGSSGSGSAVTTMSPYLTLNHIIRAA